MGLQEELSKAQENLKLKDKLLARLCEGSLPNSSAAEEKAKSRLEDKGYTENIRVYLRNKYIVKLEELALKHEGEMREVKLDFTQQVEDLTQLVSELTTNLNETQANCKVKIKDLIDLVCEKEAVIQEREEKFDELYKFIKDKYGADFTYYKTENNAMKLNLRNRDKLIKELEDTNNKLTVSLIQLKANKADE